MTANQTEATSQDTLRYVELTRRRRAAYVATNRRGGTIEVGEGDDDTFSPVDSCSPRSPPAPRWTSTTSSASGPRPSPADRSSGRKVRDERGGHLARRGPSGRWSEASRVGLGPLADDVVDVHRGAGGERGEQELDRSKGGVVALADLNGAAASIGRDVTRLAPSGELDVPQRVLAGGFGLVRRHGASLSSKVCVLVSAGEPMAAIRPRTLAVKSTMRSRSRSVR